MRTPDGKKASVSVAIPRATVAGSTSGQRQAALDAPVVLREAAVRQELVSGRVVFGRLGDEFGRAGLDRPSEQRVVERAADPASAAGGRDKYPDPDPAWPGGDIWFFHVPVSGDPVLLDSHPGEVHSVARAARLRAGDLVSADGPRREAR